MRRRAEPRRGNLPVAVTSFVGRQREIADVRALLGRSRLVTLTGAGGAGKTRLAIEVADRIRRAFPGGTWMADLSAITEESDVPRAVINALHIMDRSPSPAADKVVAYFRDDAALLVLDNCEHLSAACAAFANELLTRTAGLKIVATSRWALGIPGEHLFAVPPLSATEPERSEAVTLLAERTLAFRPDFTITAENGPAMARVCAALDGLPLAIELVASRLRSLSPEQLADRLERRLALLAAGSPAARPRQQTLRSVFDWSYSLCAEGERLLWARLSVFAGPFDLAAAEGVCAGKGLPEEAILEVLDRLVAQSIVIAESAGDQIRFRQLDTVRQYGRERLAGGGEDAEYRFRHRDYYLAQATRMAAAWCGPDQAAGLATLRADHDNLRAALETSMADPAGPAAALRLVTALRQHWCLDGYLAEGREWLDRALSLPCQEEASQPAGGRVDALWVAAWICLLQGDAAAALARIDDCAELAAALGDARAAGYVSSMRGTAELFAGRLPEALALFERARAAFEKIGETEGLQWVLFQLGTTLAVIGEPDRARAVSRETLRISEALEERLWRSYGLWVLGYVTWRRGQADGSRGTMAEAAEAERESLSIQREFNDPVGAALAMEILAWIRASTRDAAEAARLLAIASSVWSLTGTSVTAFGPAFAAHHDECVSQRASDLGQ